MFAHHGFEYFFKCKVYKEKTMPGPPVVNELPGNVPIFHRAATPKSDLFIDIDHNDFI